MNEYIVVKNQQIAIKAENPDEAVMKALSGEGIPSGVSYNVQIRPQPTRTAGIGVGAIPGPKPNG